MMKVINAFRDKTNMDHIFKPGDDFISDDTERINDLIKRGLIEGVDDTPSKSLKKNTTNKS
jgi:hypothetical protein